MLNFASLWRGLFFFFFGGFILSVLWLAWSASPFGRTREPVCLSSRQPVSNEFGTVRPPIEDEVDLSPKDAFSILPQRKRFTSCKDASPVTIAVYLPVSSAWPAPCFRRGSGCIVCSACAQSTNYLRGVDPSLLVARRRNGRKRTAQKAPPKTHCARMVAFELEDNLFLLAVWTGRVSFVLRVCLIVVMSAESCAWWWA